MKPGRIILRCTIAPEEFRTDSGTLPEVRPVRPLARGRLALVLQGGGALGAYQAGVYQALHEAGLEPDWVAGVSIGGINARDHRRQSARPPAGAAARILGDASPPGTIWLFTPDGDDPRKARNAWSSTPDHAVGPAGLLHPAVAQSLAQPARRQDARPASTTARRCARRCCALVDFDLLNQRTIRYAVGAVNVLNGNFAYFDSAQAGDPAGARHGQRRAAAGAARWCGSAPTTTGTAASSPTRRCSTCWNNADVPRLAGLPGRPVQRARAPAARHVRRAGAPEGHPVFQPHPPGDRLFPRAAQDRNLLLKRVLDKLPDEQLDDEERAAEAAPRQHAGVSPSCS